MNDEFFRKMTSSAAAFDKIKDIAGVGSSSLTALSGVNAFMNNDMYKSIHNNPAFLAMSGVDLLLQNINFHQEQFNPLKAVFGNVNQMINQFEIKGLDKIGMTGISSLTASNLLANFSSNKSITFLSSFYDLAENNPTGFLNENWIKRYSKEYEKINSNLEKLVELKIIDENLILNEDLTISNNLDAESEPSDLFDKLNEYLVQVFSKIKGESSKVFLRDLVFALIIEFLVNLVATNQAPTNIGTQINNSPITINQTINIINNNNLELQLNDILVKGKYIAMVDKVVTEYKSRTAKPIATILSGTQITVIKKYRTWILVSYLDSNNLIVIGYTTINSLRK